MPSGVFDQKLSIREMFLVGRPFRLSSRGGCWQVNPNTEGFTDLQFVAVRIVAVKKIFYCKQVNMDARKHLHQ